MNYLELINRFWRIDEQQPFSPTETRLYLYLLHLSNRGFWADWVECGDRRAAAAVGVSLNSMKKARTQLQNRDLVIFVIGGKGRSNKTRYQLRCQTVVTKVTPTHICNKTKTNNKNHGFVISGSDFD